MYVMHVGTEEKTCFLYQVKKTIAVIESGAVFVRSTLIFIEYDVLAPCPGLFALQCLKGCRFSGAVRLA